MKSKKVSLRNKIVQIAIIVSLLGLILCGTIFFVSIYQGIGTYVEKDIDFFLQELHHNIEEKISYTETIVYKISKSNYIKNYVDNDLKIKSDISMQDEDFRRLINITNNQNIFEGVPIIDKVFFFKNENEFLADKYFASVFSEDEIDEQIFTDLYKDFQTSDKNYFISYKDDKIYLLYEVCQADMEYLGTLIFSINVESLKKMLIVDYQYKDIHYLMYTDDSIILSSDNIKEASIIFDSISNKSVVRPYKLNLEAGNMRAYQADLSLHLKLFVAVKEGQVFSLIYKASKLYLGLILLVLFVIALAYITSTLVLTKPLEEISERLEKVGEGEFKAKLPSYKYKELDEISLVFNEMTSSVDHLINEIYEKKIALKDLEVQFLQSQMNPHFMFNILNSIAFQAKLDGNEDIYKTLVSFSELVRAKIYHTKGEKIEISKELEHVEYYLFLQQYRYNDRLKYEIDIKDKSLLDLFIPKFAIQTLVENAVVHGVEDKIDAAVVKLEIFSQDEKLIIRVKDNGVGFDEEGHISLPIQQKDRKKSHNGIALNNIHYIIQLAYGTEYGINIYSSHTEGSIVTIVLPFDKENTNV